jgi:hypothetical protein
MIHQVEEAARYLAMGLTLVASCFVPHWRVTSQNMSLRCDMAAHLEAGKEYDLSSLVMNANGNCAKCKQPIVKTHLFATCPCGRSEVRLFGNVGEDPGVRFDHHNDPDGDPCEYGGSKVATAHAHEEFFAHLAATFNRLD